MGLFLKHKTNELCWGVWKMQESWEELTEQLQHPTLCQEALQRFSAPHRRMEWLTVRRLLQVLIGKVPEIDYQPNGKPIIHNRGMHISISHTKEYVAVILANREVGIDIEQYGQRVHKVKTRFIRTDETILPYRGDDTWSLLLHWSAKETLFKCLGTSEVDFREHLQILPFTPQIKGRIHAKEYRTPTQHTFTLQYELHPDFVLTYWEG